LSKPTSVRRLLLLIALCVIAAPARAQHSSTPAQPQKPPTPPEQQSSEDDVVRISTSLVTVPVSVMDRQGRFVADLTQDQFHLFENNVEQEIAYFENAEKPFTVALLLDTSDSTKFKLHEIQAAAIAFIEQLRPDDRVIVVAFAKSVNVLAEATNDRRVLRDAIMNTKGRGGTSLYNAVEIVVSQRLNQIRGRKAVVLLTDGVDTTSVGATYKSTLHAAEELDALVYAIQYDTQDDAAKDARSASAANGQLVSGEIVTARGDSLQVAYAQATRYLRSMTDKSGGRFYLANSTDSLRETFRKIAQELREQYSIGYYPKDGEETETAQRRIRVKISNPPNVVVRARKSYINRASPGH
jgi:Ca-activated chloride channel family protein